MTASDDDPVRRSGATPRLVSLVVVDAGGTVLGELAPFTVASPWWPDVEPIHAAHPELTVLRLLDASAAPDHVMGGRAQYVAELAAGAEPPPTVGPWTGDPAVLADHPLRLPWARPGGPAADLRWAEGEVTLSGPPRQVKSWNLSSIWRLPTSAGVVWLKRVPPFMTSEAAVLRRYGPHPNLPVLLAADGDGRVLLADMAGRDGFGATPAECRALIDVVVTLQVDAATRLADFAAVAPDWRRDPMLALAEDIVARSATARPGLRALLDGWDRRFDAIDTCRLPDTLFHGDVHAGNSRIEAGPPVVFDWGDSGIGHPLLDLASMAGGVEDPDGLRAHWLSRWAAAVPGSNPVRAWELLRPVALLRAAIVYQGFVDHIEPSERPYHAGDIDRCLDDAEAATRLSPG